MSNRLFQSIVHQMKDAIDRIIGVVDENGVVLASSELSRIGETISGIKEELLYTNDKFFLGGYTYCPINNHGKTEYIVFVEGEDSVSENLSTLMCVSLSNIKALYDEKYDKSSFVKNIILDNILPTDIYAKSKELHLNTETPRIVYLIKFSQKADIVPIDVIQNLFPDKNKDYVLTVGETDVVLVRELKSAIEAKEAEKVAKSIVDTVNSEFYIKVTVGIGTVVESIRDLAKSYKESQIALEVGKVFDNEKSIINYQSLGIGRLIYQLPTTLCEMFLQEVFKRGALDSLDRETLITIQAFFENNLNVSETSRKLFVHRNTLVYRLEKIRKLTGLDLREFDHAITFKVALMVNKYMASKPSRYI
ncbi:MAG: PucR family transcriptional regulator [Ruminococcaceae bacterium]|nr:PucR family transcriptional regulator [Oscillospiraceae bacterium]